jgi:hypothetical protein
MDPGVDGLAQAAGPREVTFCRGSLPNLGIGQS